VANNDELLGAATDTIVAATLASEPTEAAEAPASPQDEIRAVALSLSDAIDEHPWLATQLSRSPLRVGALRALETIGRQIRALGVPESSWFTVTSAVVHYILGAPGQNATDTRVLAPDVDRAEFLDTAAEAWKSSTPKTTHSPAPSRTRCASTTTASSSSPGSNSSSPASPRPPAQAISVHPSSSHSTDYDRVTPRSTRGQLEPADHVETGFAVEHDLAKHQGEPLPVGAPIQSTAPRAAADHDRPGLAPSPCPRQH
jgi:hypothetical protein